VTAASKFGEEFRCIEILGSAEADFGEGGGDGVEEDADFDSLDVFEVVDESVEVFFFGVGCFEVLVGNVCVCDAVVVEVGAPMKD
jgi:flavin-binding protein dodecin